MIRTGGGGTMHNAPLEDLDCGLCALATGDEATIEDRDRATPLCRPNNVAG